MQTTKKHYELFKTECRKWIKVFELSGFQFRFYWDELVDNKAQIDSNQLETGIIYIGFSTKFGESEKNILDEIKVIAKHEMLHCLLAEFSNMAYRRFSTENEIIKLEEKLVNKLSKLIER